MNGASRAAAIFNSATNSFQLRASFFHSSPVLERRRRNYWDSGGAYRSSSKRFNQYTRRLRKQTLLRNVSAFAEELFQSWQSNDDKYDKSSRHGGSWFRPDFGDEGFRRGKSRNRGQRARRRHFEFCEDDDDIEFEDIFHSVFGGSRYGFWSFTMDDEPRYRKSSGYSYYYRSSSNWNHYDAGYDSSTESDGQNVDMRSKRLALGLSASGPLTLEDVKNAYRSCALKWHPDRHQGSSKVAAEEKFKACSAAYQSLCDKLAVN